MVDTLWKQILSAATIIAVVWIMLGLMGYIPSPVKSIFSIIGSAQEEADTGIKTSDDYITIVSVSPSALQKGKGIYSHDPADWSGSDNPKLDKDDTIALRFDKFIDEETTICMRIWESKDDYSSPPTKAEEWIFINSKEKVSVDGKKLEIKGFKSGGWIGDYYYNIEFTDCFKSNNNKPINPDSEIIKFRIG